MPKQRPKPIHEMQEDECRRLCQSTTSSYCASSLFTIVFIIVSLSAMLTFNDCALIFVTPACASTQLDGSVGLVPIPRDLLVFFGALFNDEFRHFHTFDEPLVSVGLDRPGKGLSHCLTKHSGIFQPTRQRQ
jgi:hypothetical protein